MTEAGFVASVSQTEHDDVRSSADIEGDVGSKEEAQESELEDPERLARTVFVGNVSTDASRKELKRLFKPFGPIESVRLRGVVAANPKLPKKTALLARRMHSKSDALLAYVVFKAKEDVDLNPMSGKRTGENTGNDAEHVQAVSVPSEGNSNILSDYDPLRSVHEACSALNLTIFHDKHLRVNPAEHKRGPLRRSVFLGNLPFDVTEEDVILAFQGIAKTAGSRLVGVRVNRDRETGMGVGIGFASFDDELGVRAALNMLGELKIRGRVVRMDRASKLKKRNTKTAKRKAKREAKLAKRNEGGNGDNLQPSKRAKQREKKKEQQRGELGVSRKIRKARKDHKLEKKVKHAARKARKAQGVDKR